jgi:hypothetical protein
MEFALQSFDPERKKESKVSSLGKQRPSIKLAVKGIKPFSFSFYVLFPIADGATFALLHQECRKALPVPGSFYHVLSCPSSATQSSQNIHLVTHNPINNHPSNASAMTSHPILSQGAKAIARCASATVPTPAKAAASSPALEVPLGGTPFCAVCRAMSAA